MFWRCCLTKAFCHEHLWRYRLRQALFLLVWVLGLSFLAMKGA